MTTTSNFPLTINGVRLDTLAFNISTYDGRRGMPSKRLASVLLPGVHGALPVLSNGSFEVGSFILKMWVAGAEVDGTVPHATSPSRKLYDRNLDAIFHLFSTTDRLLDLRQKMGDGSVRQAYGRVTESVIPAVGGAEWAIRAEVTVSLEIPSVFWQDAAEQSFVGTASASSPHNLTVTTLTGSTAPIEDGIFLVYGPAASGVRLSCPDLGSWIVLNRALAVGEVWRVDSSRWRSVVGGTGMGFDGAFTTDVIALTDFAGSGNRLFTILPKVAGSTVIPSPIIPLTEAGRTCHLVLSGSGFGAATQVRVRARRKFL